jgi:hypothetical protein
VSLGQGVLANSETTGAFNTLPLRENAPNGLTPARVLGAIEQQPTEGPLETVIHNLSLVDTNEMRLGYIYSTN